MSVQRSVKLALLTSVVWLPCIAHAQDPSSPPASPHPAGTEPADDIVVTARRQTETLQDVPATVSVLTSAVLERTGARVTTDFVALTSGVTIQTSATEPGDTTINIRGLNGTRDAENNVALVVDGVLRTATAALAQPQGAISQVEIIKGPQGAIYGRNASAGAIVVTTRKPSDDLSGEVKGLVGDDSTYLVSALLSGPVTDQIGFTVQAEHSRSDGYYRNSFLGTPLNRQVYPGNTTDTSSIDNYERTFVFGRVMIKPSDGTEIDIKANYGDQTGGGAHYNAVFQLPLLATVFNDPIFNPKVSDHKYVFTDNSLSESWQKTWGASLRFSQDLNFGSLIGYVGYSSIKGGLSSGGTSAAFGFFANEPNCIRTAAATAGFPNQEPFSTYEALFGSSLPYAPSTCDGHNVQIRNQKDVVSEIRLVSPSTSALQWQVGASYIYIDRRVCVSTSLDTGVPAPHRCFSSDPATRTESLVDDDFKTDVYAGFASLEYKPTEKLTLGAAARYDIEARDTSNNVPVNERARWIGNPRTGFPIGTATTPSNYYLNPGLDPAFNPSGVLAPRSKTYKQWQPKLTASYEPNPDTTLFASWGLGFKAGGFNNAGSAAIVDGYFNPPVESGGLNAGLKISDEFKKEVVSAYELGIKGRIGRGFNYELTGFYTDVDDMQFFEFFVGGFGLLRTVSNIDKVRNHGFEALVNYTFAPGYSIFASGNYTHSEIRKNSSRPYTVGNKSPYTPDYTLNLGVQGLQPITDTLRVLGRIDARITGPTYFHTVQDNDVPTIFGIPANFRNATRDTFTTVNVRLGVEGDNWSLTAFSTNIFKEKVLNDNVLAPEFGGTFVSPGALRRIGVEGSFKF